MVACSLPIVLRVQSRFRDQHKSKLPQKYEFGADLYEEMLNGMSINKDENLYFTKIELMGVTFKRKSVLCGAL